MAKRLHSTSVGSLRSGARSRIG